jgi:serine/threonine protein kinase/tetratricopeptide (TPR) repeat protein
MPDPRPTAAVADRNLLFGILALQMDFISRDRLVAGMHAWVLDKGKPLGRILVEQGALRDDLHAALEVMVQKHVEMHGNDAQKSLASLSSADAARRDLQQIADGDVQASLGHVGAGRSQEDDIPTRGPDSVGLRTAEGMRFRVLRPHARGGLGEVFVARDEELGREVALKQIQSNRADDNNARSRFLLEAEITGGLEHPGIVPVYGLGAYADGRPFYAMRFIRGDSLKEAIGKFHGKPRAPAGPGDRQPPGRPRFGSREFHQLLRRFLDVCNAVAYAHSRGVLHRDLKPGNVMLGPYGETLVVDWGLAKAGIAGQDSATQGDGGSGRQPGVEPILQPASGSACAQTLAGSAVGTPQYMSPEQAAGRLDQLGPASDVYSLGATLYCLLTGHDPFDERDLGELLRRVQRGEVVRPRQRVADVPAPLDAICLKAMALAPTDRYVSPRDLADELERWLADEPVQAWPEPWTVRAGRWVRRHKTGVSSAAAALAVALLAGTAALFWQQSEQHRRATEFALRQRSVREALEQTAAVRQEYQTILARGGGVFKLLDQPERWHAQIQVARASLEKASGLAHSGPADMGVEMQQIEDLQQAIDQDDEDRRLALRLEKIRIDRATAIQGRFDNATPAREYPLAFADGGFKLEQPAEQLAPRIRASSVKDQLIAALDDWALLTFFYVPTKNLPDQLLELARCADGPSPWSDAIRQTNIWKNAAAIEQLSKTALANKTSPQMLALVARLLGANNLDRESWLRDAQARFPSDFWLNYLLGNTLLVKAPVEAAGFYRAALAVRPANIATYNNLGNALRLQQRLGEAIFLYGKTVELDPSYAGGYLNLGIAHYDQRQFAQAVAAFRKAIDSDARYVDAHNNLGNALRGQKLVREAIAAYRQAISIDPAYAPAHQNLGQALQEQGLLEEALTAYGNAIELRPQDASLRNDVGIALARLQRYAEAVAAFEEAVRLDPRSALAHLNLGVALRGQALGGTGPGGLGDDAVWPRAAAADKRTWLGRARAAYEKAVQLDAKLAQAHGGLGEVLLWQGSFAHAAAAHEKALELLPAKHPLRAANERCLERCRRLIVLEKLLPGVVAGTEPVAPATLVEIAQLCQDYKGFNATAARLYLQALTAEPGSDLIRGHRYQAARAAVLAACGETLEPIKLSAAEAAGWRRQARTWLGAEVQAHAAQLKGAKSDDVGPASPALGQWQQDPDLAAVRDARALQDLPADEHESWRQLWSEVARLASAGR